MGNLRTRSKSVLNYMQKPVEEHTTIVSNDDRVYENQLVIIELLTEIRDEISKALALPQQIIYDPSTNDSTLLKRSNSDKQFIPSVDVEGYNKSVSPITTKKKKRDLNKTLNKIKELNNG